MRRRMPLHHLCVTDNTEADYEHFDGNPQCWFLDGVGSYLAVSPMPWYAIATTTLISNLRKQVADAKQVWLADDTAAAGSLRHLQDWYEALCDIGVNSGYHVNRTKSWLILRVQ